MENPRKTEPGGQQSSPRQELKKEAKHAFIYIGTNAFTQLGALLLIPLYWRKLTPADYGIISITEIIAILLSAYVHLALDQSISRYYYKWPEGERKARIGTLWIGSWVATAVLGGATLGLLYFAAPLIFPAVPYFPFLFLGTLIGLLAQFRLVAFVTLRIMARPYQFAAYTLTVFFLTTALGIWFVLVRDEGLMGYFKAQIAAGIALFLVCAGIMAWHSTPRFHLPYLRESLGFCLPIVPNNIFSVATHLLDRFLLQRFASLEAVGIYALTLRFVNIVSSLHDSVKTAYGPFQMKTVEDKSRGVEFLAKATPVYLIPIFLTAVGIALFIEPVIRIIGMPAYFPIIDYVPAMSCVTLLAALYVYFSPGIILSGRTKLLLIPSTVQLALMATAGPLLIIGYNLEGVVAAKFIVAAVFFGLSTIISHKVFPIPYSWRKMGGWIGITFLAIASAHAVGHANLFVDLAERAGVLGLYLAVVLAMFRRNVAGAFPGLAKRIPGLG